MQNSFYGQIIIVVLRKIVRICDSRKCFWVKPLCLQVLHPYHKFLSAETSENNIRHVTKITFKFSK
jgi:hypothetical protein